MTGNEYQELAMRTYDGKAKVKVENLLRKTGIDGGGLINAIFGLTGELGEFVDILKKVTFHGAPEDSEHLKKELGDVMWYVALAAHSMGWCLDDIMECNIDKLKKRYPNGFSEYLANNRRSDDV